jgi:asparagine synthase (glutamine-hydrolysing)
MRYNYVPAPRSIYRGIQKLPPARWLTVGADGVEKTGSYWSLRDVAAAAQAAPRLSDTDAIVELEDVLGAAVKGQMMADVPLGAFLSGGVDSSAIVALMCRHSSSRVRTFSIGFREPEFNEAEFAKVVARHLGTEHSELYVTANDALQVVPGLPEIYDEPFADASQIPTYLVMRMARQHVTVALSGDGGDELFAGYNRYLIARRLWRKLAVVPRPIRSAAARALLSVSPAAWNCIARVPGSMMPAHQGRGNVGDKLHKFATSVLPADSLRDMYRALVSHWDKPHDVVVDVSEGAGDGEGMDAWDTQSDPIDSMRLVDELSYLPDDILVKVDRAAMAVSLETRVPLLDHRVVELSWRLGIQHLLRAGESKWLLRQVLYKHVPRNLIDRPKQGFAVPLAEWLRGPLRDWAEDLISESRLRQGGYFISEVVRQKWNEHQSCRRNWQYLLWDVLMFQSWLKRRSAGSSV